MLDVDIKSGSTAVDYSVIAKKEHLDDISLQIRKLSDEAQNIRKEQSYQKVRETRFRETTASTNSRVFWWSLIQLVIVVGAMYMQTRYLKKFIKSKIF